MAGSIRVALARKSQSARPKYRLLFLAPPARVSRKNMKFLKTDWRSTPYRLQTSRQTASSPAEPSPRSVRFRFRKSGSPGSGPPFPTPSLQPRILRAYHPRGGSASSGPPLLRSGVQARRIGSSTRRTPLEFPSIAPARLSTEAASIRPPDAGAKVAGASYLPSTYSTRSAAAGEMRCTRRSGHQQPIAVTTMVKVTTATTSVERRRSGISSTK